jgi:hypothetical protein
VSGSGHQPSACVTLRKAVGGTAVLRALVFVLMALGLGACSQEAILARYEPLQETLLARESIDLLRARNFEALLAKLAPEVRNDPATAANLPSVAAYFPDAEPLSVKLVEYRFLSRFSFTGATPPTNYTIGFEYEFPQTFVLAVAMLQSANSETSVLGLRLFRNSVSLETLNALTFQGKGAIHFVFMVLAAAILAFMIVTLIACIRTRVPRRKWLWIVFIIVGIGQFGLNWTTGEVGFSPAINLFGVGMTKQPFAPWFLHLAFPLGAILFWWRRRTWVERSADQFA